MAMAVSSSRSFACAQHAQGPRSVFHGHQEEHPASAQPSSAPPLAAAPLSTVIPPLRLVNAPVDPELGPVLVVAASVSSIPGSPIGSPRAASRSGDVSPRLANSATEGTAFEKFENVIGKLHSPPGADEAKCPLLSSWLPTAKPIMKQMRIPGLNIRSYSPLPHDLDPYGSDHLSASQQLQPSPATASKGSTSIAQVMRGRGGPVTIHRKPSAGGSSSCANTPRLRRVVATMTPTTTTSSQLVNSGSMGSSAMATRRTFQPAGRARFSPSSAGAPDAPSPRTIALSGRSRCRKPLVMGEAAADKSMFSSSDPFEGAEDVEMYQQVVQQEHDMLQGVPKTGTSSSPSRVSLDMGQTFFARPNASSQKQLATGTPGPGSARPMAASTTSSGKGALKRSPIRGTAPPEQLSGYQRAKQELLAKSSANLRKNLNFVACQFTPTSVDVMKLSPRERARHETRVRQTQTMGFHYTKSDGTGRPGAAPFYPPSSDFKGRSRSNSPKQSPKQSVATLQTTSSMNEHILLGAAAATSGAAAGGSLTTPREREGLDAWKALLSARGSGSSSVGNAAGTDTAGEGGNRVHAASYGVANTGPGVDEHKTSQLNLEQERSTATSAASEAARPRHQNLAHQVPEAQCSSQASQSQGAASSPWKLHMPTGGLLKADSSALWTPLDGGRTTPAIMSMSGVNLLSLMSPPPSGAAPAPATAARTGAQLVPGATATTSSSAAVDVFAAFGPAAAVPGAASPTPVAPQSTRRSDPNKCGRPLDLSTPRATPRATGASTRKAARDGRQEHEEVHAHAQVNVNEQDEDGRTLDSLAAEVSRLTQRLKKLEEQNRKLVLGGARGLDTAAAGDKSATVGNNPAISACITNKSSAQPQQQQANAKPQPQPVVKNRAVPPEKQASRLRANAKSSGAATPGTRSRSTLKLATATGASTREAARSSSTTTPRTRVGSRTASNDAAAKRLYEAESHNPMAPDDEIQQFVDKYRDFPLQIKKLSHNSYAIGRGVSEGTSAGDMMSHLHANRKEKTVVVVERKRGNFVKFGGGYEPLSKYLRSLYVRRSGSSGRIDEY